MLNTDANTLRGLAQLSPVVKSMFSDELLVVLDVLIDCPDPVLLHRMQGRARLLKDIINLIDQADQGPSRR
jgi:hypothetical protein